MLGSPPIVLDRPPATVAEIGYESGVVLFLGTTKNARWLTKLFPEIVDGCVGLGWEAYVDTATACSILLGRYSRVALLHDATSLSCTLPRNAP